MDEELSSKRMSNSERVQFVSSLKSEPTLSSLGLR
jgi:hypothetical protein